MKSKKIRFILLLMLIFSISYLIFFTIINKNYNNTSTKIEIGNTVIYEPPEKFYVINMENINENSGLLVLNNKDKTLKVTTWKVLNIKNDVIELVPQNIPKYKLKIYGPQGYNNGVYILNEICNNLYSNPQKGIVARSINIEDIENIFYKNNSIKELININNNTKFYGIQPKKTGYLKEESRYPAIYELEKNSVINSNVRFTGLDLSDQNDQLIIKQVKKQAENSIQPYKSFYNTINYKTTSKLLNDENWIYKKILLPNKKHTNYWVASRAIGNGENSIHFDLRRIYKWFLRWARLYDSRDIESGEESNIFPVISVNINSIIKKDKNTFIVK